MYRMQVFGPDTAGMHWHRHKTGANHYEEWKKTEKKMPVSVSLGGDPVYAWCATAPLPENIDEYILAGFLRKKRVKLVKCLTNDIYVPADADIVIEGFVDPAEPLVTEGPFGDHTGFYSLADLYPVFHVTCITHARDAVYPATIVGIPPHEDAYLAMATEKIFLSPMKLAIQPEIIDFHMPEPGVAHNLVIVKVKKSFPGQGMKVISSLSGAGQMMFSKYIVVVSGDVDIRNYAELTAHVLQSINPERDFMFSSGPMDVLDHSSDSFSFGGKAGVDATVKLPEETGGIAISYIKKESAAGDPSVILNAPFVKEFREYPVNGILGILVIGTDPSEDPGSVAKICGLLKDNYGLLRYRLVLVVDHTVDLDNLYVVAWQILGNSDPRRDHCFIAPDSVLIDGTIKLYRPGGFPRLWPNVVCSDKATIESVDAKWDALGFDSFVPSFSLKFERLVRKGKDTASA
jgi:4-hydroxy-3-polyprenylbenzoate decarboxylase